MATIGCEAASKTFLELIDWVSQIKEVSVANRCIRSL